VTARAAPSRTALLRRARRMDRELARLYPDARRNRSRAATDCAYLVTVPSFSGRRDPGAAFFTVNLPGGTHAYVLAVIEHASRRIRILGVTLHQTGEWATQQARNLLMDLDEQVHRVRFMIRDRGSNFTPAFDAVLADTGVGPCSVTCRRPA
jgi:hypothetical protein